MADDVPLKNWAGLHEFRPTTISHPATEAELCDAIGAGAASHGRVKAIGSAHTNTDLADTAGTLLVLDRYTGVVAADPPSGTVEVRAGTPLHQLNDELAALGLALPALGDIDRQTVSGATSTGTHGTGRSVRTISAQIVSARLITADGSPLVIGPDDPRLLAVRVGLGALGVLSTVTLRCVPAFTLHAIDGPARLDDALAAFGGAVEANDHAEMYWMPGTDWALMRASAHEPNAWRPPDPGPIDAIDDTSQFVLGILGHWQPEHGAVHRWSDRSDRVFCSERDTKFVEMEYALPRASLMQAFDVVRNHCAEHGPLGMPVEIRVTVADDSWLSMGSGRDTAFIAIHDWPKAAWQQPFQAIEEQFRALDGRPHWGKMHWRAAADLAPAYPRWAEFAALRNELDPRRVFANSHLDRVLGP